MNDLLHVLHASSIEEAQGDSWLIRDLWAAEGVGILGGRPKSCKTWLALELALAVATDTPALDRFPVEQSGPVLVFAAEDSPAMVRGRLEALAKHRGVSLERAPIHVIVENALRLDREDDRERLARTVERYQARFLVLDPFVRLHRLDENSALEVSGVLAYLRELQRASHVAILVCHHARKAGATIDQIGLSLRGSGDLHAWGDSNLYLRRNKGALELIVEHRNAAPLEPFRLELDTTDDAPRLIALGPARQAQASDLQGALLEALDPQRPSKTSELRDQLKVRNQRLTAALRELAHSGKIQRSGDGWRLAPSD